jgi:hypothetical protein
LLSVKIGQIDIGDGVRGIQFDRMQISLLSRIELTLTQVQQT